MMSMYIPWQDTSLLWNSMRFFHCVIILVKINWTMSVYDIYKRPPLVSGAAKQLSRSIGRKLPHVFLAGCKSACLFFDFLCT